MGARDMTKIDQLEEKSMAKHLMQLIHPQMPLSLCIYIYIHMHQIRDTQLSMGVAWRRRASSKDHPPRPVSLQDRWIKNQNGPKRRVTRTKNIQQTHLPCGLPQEVPVGAQV